MAEQHDLERSQVVLEFVRDHIRDRGYPPTTREITTALGLSSTRVTHELLVGLRAEGKLDWDEGRARTLRVVNDTAQHEHGGKPHPAGKPHQSV